MAELRDASQMFPLVETWLQSGRTQEEFSNIHGMSKHVLSYWVCKYRKAQRSDEQKPKPDAASFLQIHTPAAVSSSSMEVVLPTGVVIRFASPISADYLQQLLKACSV